MAIVTDDRGHKVMGAGWGWILAYGIVSVLVGIAAFVMPFLATLAATYIVGAFLIATGVVSLGAGIFGRGHQGRGYSILLGVLALVIGVVTVFQPVTGAISLTILVAAWLGARGVLELVAGARFRRGRALMIVLGIVNILLALFIIWSVPFSALTLPGYILGISFLLGGISGIAQGIDHRSGAPAFASPA